MKVAFDHQIFALQRYGGISRYFFELASRLPADTVSEVSIIAPFHINEYLRADSAGGFSQGRYVPAFADNTRALDVVNRFAVPLAWRDANPDIVHETYFAVEPVGTARRRVVTVYDMIHELRAEEFEDVWRVIAAKRAAVERADHIICNSENTRRDLVRLYGIDPARTSVVHYGYSLATQEEYPPNPEHSGRRPSLLYVGKRLGYKNFMALLRAYGRSAVLREFDLIAFGGEPVGPEEVREIERWGIGDRVRFESGPDGELSARYQSATAFIYPSKYEGFGHPPLEAMSHGCPVVCSNAGSIPEIVGDAGLYFDPNEVEELRTALERVATSEALQADLRARGYARITAFSWDECAAATARIYKDIL